MNLRTDGMIDFREDISEDFDESLIKTAEKCMQQVIDKELKSFTYLELAQ